METSLYYFKGVQDVSTPEVSFSYLNIVKAVLANENNSPKSLGYALPTLKFNCEFCSQTYNTAGLLMNHLESQHKLEPSYICRLCMKSSPINQLSFRRWKHNCNEQACKVPPAVVRKS